MTIMTLLRNSFLVFSISLCSLVLGCGAGGSATTPAGPGTLTPTVKVNASLQTPTTIQPFSVTVSVESGGSNVDDGTVALSSGSFATFPATLTNGQAIIAVPAGVLPIGDDAVIAQFTPARADVYASATGSTSVSVSASTGNSPQVSATEVFIPTVVHPFKAIPLSSEQVLVSVGGISASTGIQVFSPSTSGLSSTCLNTLSTKLMNQNASSLGMALSQDASTVALTLSDPGVDFFSTSNLLNCQASGTGFYIPQGPLSAMEGTINAVFSADGKYAFVANEYGSVAGATSPGNVGVVALQRDGNGNVTTGSTLVGQISTGGNSVPGLTLSPDGRRLYVMSEITTPSAPVAAGGSNTVLTHNGCLQAAGSTPKPNGLLTVIDVAAAEATPGSNAILETVNAGCSPGRAVETSDNNILYVAARGDDRVLVFSTGMLEADPNNALIGYTDTGGTAPVGLQLFHKEQFLAVANSDRFNTGTPANATILNVMSPEIPSLAYTVPTYLFPREFGLASDDATLYLTNYGSDLLEVISPVVH